jgi:hypothetical protein
MSKKNKLALLQALKEVKKNTPVIERKLAKAGVKPDPVLLFFAAKNYRALNKLAKA